MLTYSKSITTSFTVLAFIAVAEEPGFRISDTEMDSNRNGSFQVAAWKDKDGDWYETGLHIFCKQPVLFFFRFHCVEEIEA